MLELIVFDKPASGWVGDCQAAAFSSTRSAFFPSHSDLWQARDDVGARYVACLLTSLPALFNQLRSAGVKVRPDFMLWRMRLLTDGCIFQKRREMRF